LNNNCQKIHEENMDGCAVLVSMEERINERIMNDCVDDMLEFINENEWID